MTTVNPIGWSSPSPMPATLHTDQDPVWKSQKWYWHFCCFYFARYNFHTDNANTECSIFNQPSAQTTAIINSAEHGYWPINTSAGLSYLQLVGRITWSLLVINIIHQLVVYHYITSVSGTSQLDTYNGILCQLLLFQQNKPSWISRILDIPTQTRPLCYVLLTTEWAEIHWLQYCTASLFIYVIYTQLVILGRER